MSSAELANLAKIGQIKAEALSLTDVARLVRSGDARLSDATNRALTPESRFDLAYNAAHAFSLAALRLAGYRSENRFTVFQCLPHTLAAPLPVWRLLAKCHGMRNTAEYEGGIELDERLIDDLVSATGAIRRLLQPYLQPEG